MASRSIPSDLKQIFAMVLDEYETNGAKRALDSLASLRLNSTNKSLVLYLLNYDSDLINSLFCTDIKKMRRMTSMKH